MMRIIEVGPRDGLQNESKTIPTDVKVNYVNALSASGLVDIEVSAFVSPKWVPQLRDAEQVFERIERHPDVVYSALVPNECGLERALAARVDKIALFTAASETFTQKNINTSIAGSFERFTPVCRRASALELPMRGYVSTAFWCPYEGMVAPADVLPLVLRLLDLGVEEVSIGDTIGKATAQQVTEVLELLLASVPKESLAMHFHDTYGNAAANVRVAASLGITRFDSSTGGIGGCPYAPGAAGNVATEVVVQTLNAMGFATAVDVQKLHEAARMVQECLHSSGPVVS